MGRRRLADQAELAAHLEWARVALHDRNLDVRLVLEALVDAIETVAGMTPDRARPDHPAAVLDEPGVVLR